MDLFDKKNRLELVAFIKAQQPRVEYNGEMFLILEGNVRTLLDRKILKDLGPDSYKEAATRQVPINVFVKIVDKQTRIYGREVVRTVEGPNVSEADRQWLKWYEDTLDINMKLAANNRNYNAFLYALLQIGLKDIDALSGMGTPFVRSLPNHQFLVYNLNTNPDPTAADIILVCIGEYKNALGVVSPIWAVYSDSQYIIMDMEADIMTDMMDVRDADGVNPYDAVPFTYANASQNLAMPMIQTDNLDMTLLTPLLLTDLNYAVKFQAFAVFVAVDIADGEIKISPNAVIRLKSDGKGENPSFTAIKPTVDITEALNLAASQMGLWLSSKGIRPGTVVANVGADTFSSGISKMIDESDTYESEKNQIQTYLAFERDFWDRLARKIHPVWVVGNRVANKHVLSDGAYIKTVFAKPVPLQTRGELVADIAAEVEGRLTSRKRAIKRLNPDMDDAQIEELIAEIDADQPVVEAEPGNLRAVQ